MVSKEGLREYLERSIDTAIDRHDLNISDDARKHVISVLEKFSVSLELFEDDSYGLEPITFQYFQAAKEMGIFSRLQKHEKLGDHCLFLLGYFYDMVRKQGKSQVNFHADTGSSAYRETGNVELATNFPSLCYVISDLHLPSIDSDEKIVELYQKWQRTEDRYYESLLLGKGIVPQKFKNLN
jgi:hypothetical protein